MRRRRWMMGSSTLFTLSCKQAVAQSGGSPGIPARAEPTSGASSGLSMVEGSVSEYCDRHTVAESEVMAAIAKDTHANTEMAIMMVGPMQAAFLRLMVQLTGARRVVEVGTFTGYSAIAMAEGLPADGRVITLDISEEWTSIGRKHWARSPHGEKIDLRLGPAADTLKMLAGPFDVAFIDADKGGYPAYWDAIVPKMRAGGLVIVDNVLAGGEVAEPQSAFARTMDAFNAKVRADTRVAALMLPIRDGVTVARVL